MVDTTNFHQGRKNLFPSINICRLRYRLQNDTCIYSGAWQKYVPTETKISLDYQRKLATTYTQPLPHPPLYIVCGPGTVTHEHVVE